MEEKCSKCKKCPGCVFRIRPSIFMGGGEYTVPISELDRYVLYH